jgi:hypothetical protein
VEGDPNFASTDRPPAQDGALPSADHDRRRAVAVIGCLMVTFDAIIWLGEFHEVRFPMLLRMGVNLFLIYNFYVGRRWARFALAVVSALTVAMNHDQFSEIRWSMWTCVIFAWLAFHILVVGACLAAPRLRPSPPRTD